MKPKYKLGQMVFFMCDNCVYSEQVTAIFNVAGQIRYRTDAIANDTDIGKAWDYSDESSFFPTKEALLKSL